MLIRLHPYWRYCNRQKSAPARRILSRSTLSYSSTSMHPASDVSPVSCTSQLILTPGARSCDKSAPDPRDLPVWSGSATKGRRHAYQRGRMQIAIQMLIAPTAARLPQRLTHPHLTIPRE